MSRPTGSRNKKEAKSVCMKVYLKPSDYARLKQFPRGHLARLVEKEIKTLDINQGPKI